MNGNTFSSPVMATNLINPTLPTLQLSTQRKQTSYLQYEKLVEFKCDCTSGERELVLLRAARYNNDSVWYGCSQPFFLLNDRRILYNSIIGKRFDGFHNYRAPIFEVDPRKCMTCQYYYSSYCSQFKIDYAGVPLHELKLRCSYNHTCNDRHGISFCRDLYQHYKNLAGVPELIDYSDLIHWSQPKYYRLFSMMPLNFVSFTHNLASFDYMYNAIMSLKYECDECVLNILYSIFESCCVFRSLRHEDQFYGLSELKMVLFIDGYCRRFEKRLMPVELINIILIHLDRRFDSLFHLTLTTTGVTFTKAHYCFHGYTTQEYPKGELMILWYRYLYGLKYQNFDDEAKRQRMINKLQHIMHGNTFVGYNVTFFNHSVLNVTYLNNSILNITFDEPLIEIDHSTKILSAIVASIMIVISFVVIIKAVYVCVTHSRAYIFARWWCNIKAMHQPMTPVLNKNYVNLIANYDQVPPDDYIQCLFDSWHSFLQYAHEHGHPIDNWISDGNLIVRGRYQFIPAIASNRFLGMNVSYGDGYMSLTTTCKNFRIPFDLTQAQDAVWSNSYFIALAPTNVHNHLGLWPRLLKSTYVHVEASNSKPWTQKHIILSTIGDNTFLYQRHSSGYTSYIANTTLLCRLLKDGIAMQPKADFIGRYLSNFRKILESEKELDTTPYIHGTIIAGVALGARLNVEILAQELPAHRIALQYSQIFSDWSQPNINVVDYDYGEQVATLLQSCQPLIGLAKLRPGNEIQPTYGRCFDQKEGIWIYGPAVARELCVASSCSHNAYHACVERQCKDFNVPEAPDNFIDWCHHIAVNTIDVKIDHVINSSIWAKRFGGSKSECYAEAVRFNEEDYVPTEFQSKFTSFVKREILVGKIENFEPVFVPRLITSSTYNYATQVGPLIYTTAKALRFAWGGIPTEYAYGKTFPGIYFTSGLNKNDLGSLFEKTLDQLGADCVIGNFDFSRYDAHLQKNHLLGEFELYKHFYNSVEVEPIRKFVLQQGDRRGILRARDNIIPARFKWSRKSGDPNTSSGNSFITVCLLTYALSHYFDVLSELKSGNIIIWVMGDDSLIFYRSGCQYIPDIKGFISKLYNMGIETKGNYVSPNGVVYCSNVFIPTMEGYMATQLPGRNLCKAYATIHKYKYDRARYWVHSNAYAYMRDFQHVPILSMFHLLIYNSTLDCKPCELPVERYEIYKHCSQPQTYCQATFDWFMDRYSLDCLQIGDLSDPFKWIQSDFVQRMIDVDIYGVDDYRNISKPKVISSSRSFVVPLIKPVKMPIIKSVKKIVQQSKSLLSDSDDTDNDVFEQLIVCKGDHVKSIQLNPNKRIRNVRSVIAARVNKPSNQILIYDSKLNLLPDNYLISNIHNHLQIHIT
jgi:hypothetical protein